MHLARIFLLALSVASAVRAQDLPTAFTLQEAIAFALEHNYSSINASRDLVDAQKQKWEVIADGLPQIDGSINYQDQLIQPVSLIPGDFFPGGEPGTFVPIIFGPPQVHSCHSDPEATDLRWFVHRRCTGDPGLSQL